MNHSREYGLNRLLIARRITHDNEEPPTTSFEYTDAKLETNFPHLTICTQPLAPGRYIVMAEAAFPNKTVGEVTLSLYTNTLANLTQIPPPDPHFLHKVFAFDATRIPP
jgi:hypothetical protein